MTAFTAVAEKCPTTGLYVGYVPGFPGAHSQGETLDELRQNPQEVIEMLLEEELQPSIRSLSEHKQFRLPDDKTSGVKA